VEHLPQASLLKGRFGGIVNMTGVAKLCFASPFIRRKATLNRSLFCGMVIDYRTFIDDYLKIVEFIEWLKDFYPEKATFLMKSS
jgi:hypothetical protein